MSEVTPCVKIEGFGRANNAVQRSVSRKRAVDRPECSDLLEARFWGDGLGAATSATTSALIDSRCFAAN
jgi:hypothetical protein